MQTSQQMGAEQPQASRTPAQQQAQSQTQSKPQQGTPVRLTDWAAI